MSKVNISEQNIYSVPISIAKDDESERESTSTDIDDRGINTDSVPFPVTVNNEDSQEGTAAFRNEHVEVSQKKGNMDEEPYKSSNQEFNSKSKSKKKKKNKASKGTGSDETITMGDEGKESISTAEGMWSAKYFISNKLGIVVGQGLSISVSSIYQMSKKKIF